MKRAGFRAFLSVPGHLLEKLMSSLGLLDEVSCCCARGCKLRGCEGANATAGVSTLSLSLVLPCFNEEQNIERTIRESQDWFSDAGVDGQVVVTDDGSSDGSLRLLHRLQGEMPNLKIVRHEKNRGYGAAIRSGCDQAARQPGVIRLAAG